MADTTLSADQSGDHDDAAFGLALVAGDGPRGGDFLIKIDDEFEYVEWRGDQHERAWQVRRGFLGTTPADHDSGATVSVEPSLAGGGSIAATDTQIVYMDGADAVGSANLTWDDATQVLGITAGAAGHGHIRAIGLGAELQIRAANGDDTEVGGELSLATGNGDGNNSGDLQIVTGNDSGGGDTGSIAISTGGALSGQSGAIDIKVGLGYDSAVGGSITIQGGTGQTGNGGSVIIAAGNKVTGGSHGTVQLYSGDGNQGIELNSSGLFLNGSRVGTQAAHVADGSTVDQLRDALIASGLMAAS